VDHPLPAPDALVRPWRTAAYVAVAIAAVELLLLLLIGGGKLAGWASDRMQLAARQRVAAPIHRTHASPAASHKQTPAPVAKRPRSKTVVLVLNGNGRTGAAASAASRVQSRGYRIGDVTNAPELVPRSIVMYKPGFAGEGRRLGKDLGVKLVTPLDGMRPQELGPAHVVFILGP
jgi:LytR cell envelope-related transcriptional attenuator